MNRVPIDEKHLRTELEWCLLNFSKQCSFVILTGIELPTKILELLIAKRTVNHGPAKQIVLYPKCKDCSRFEIVRKKASKL